MHQAGFTYKRLKFKELQSTKHKTKQSSSLCLIRTWPILICTISTSTVGIATSNELDSPGIESSRPNSRHIQPTVQELPGAFPGVKRQERIAAHPPPSSARLQMDCHYNSSSPLRLLGHAIGWPSPSTISNKIIYPVSNLLHPKYRTTSYSNIIS